MQEDPRSAMRSSLRALLHHFTTIFGIAIIVAVIGYGFVRQFPVTYEVNFSAMVSMNERDAAPGFRYDGYYALSATDLFSSTLAGIITSPETIVAAYKEAAIALPTQDAVQLTKIVRAEKVAPQLVRIRVIHASRETAEDLARGLLNVMDASIREYNEKGNASLAFSAVPTTSWTSTSHFAPLPVAISLFILIFGAGNILILFREALSRGSS